MKSSRIIPMISMYLIVFLIFCFGIVSASEDELYQDYYLNLDLINPHNDTFGFNLDYLQNNLSLDNEFDIKLNYNIGTQYDTDDDGVENLNGVVDLSVGSTVIEDSYDHNKLCTRWDIYSIDKEMSTVVCYGYEQCCNFVDLVPTKDSWDDVLFVHYDLYGILNNNLVSSQILYVDFNISLENPYSDIVYSEWDSLPVVFEEGVFYLHDSNVSNEIILSPSMDIRITSPNDIDYYNVGEDIYLNITSNCTIITTCSFFDQLVFDSLEGNNFLAILNGSLPFGVIPNGEQVLVINVTDEENNTFYFDYTFRINDTTSPNFSINVTNQSSYSGHDIVLNIEFVSDEFGLYSYKINDGDYNQFVDLGVSKTGNFEVSLENGINKVYLKVKDYQNNIRSNYYVFYFEDVGTCNDGTQNGDEEGIDCGGNCPVCIEFDAALNGEEFEIDEEVFVTVTARPYSSVDMTVYRGSDVVDSHTFTPLFSGARISERRLIENTDVDGHYYVDLVMNYLDITENEYLDFNVIEHTGNPLGVDIKTDNSKIDEGENISFSARVSGQGSDIEYEWDFDNDGDVEKTSSSFVHEFPDNGTYKVNLTVYSGGWQKSDLETIIVRNLFDVHFIIRDNYSGNKVEKALIEFNNKEKNSSNVGEATFDIRSGRFDLVVEKQGYLIYTDDIDVDDKLYVHVNLTRYDDISPRISLINPEDDQKLSGLSVNLSYKARDESSMDCKVYLREVNSEFWEVINTKSNLKDDETGICSSGELSNGTYEWKVECIDKRGNKNFSSIRSFSLDEKVENVLSFSLESQDTETDDFVSQVRSSIDSIKYYDSKTKDAAETLQLKKILERAITEIERANRDLHSLKWRRLNDTDLEVETQKIFDRIDNVKKNTPKLIEILDSDEFVKYPSKEEVEEATMILLNQTNLRLSKRELRNVIEENHKLQDSLTITTKVTILSVEYMYGVSNIITLIEKQISGERNFSGVVFYEVIPKDIVEKVNETVMLFEYEVIEEDPVISIDISGLNHYAYYVNKRIRIDEVENIKSVLLYSDSKTIKSRGVTGFSVFNVFSSSFFESGDIRLIIEIIIIVILAGLYLMYSFGGFDAIKKRFVPREIKEIQELLIHAHKQLQGDSYENASADYKKINPIYQKLDPKKKSMVKAPIVDLVNKMNMVYINKLVTNANTMVANKNKKGAYSIYSKIQSLYSVIPKQYKAEVSKKCLELHGKLMGG